MRQIAKEYEDGVPVEQIAKEYDISTGSVYKKIEKIRLDDKRKVLKEKVYKEALEYSTSLPKVHVARSWTDELIKEGIDRFISEHGHMPTATEFSLVDYLPSARQIQRTHGGMAKLREKFGYQELDFTKGVLRKKIATAANKRGLDAEDYFEPLLVEHFGEPFVHVQKRYYKGSKNRYDFLIYSENRVFGIDIFTTDRHAYIGNNIRHKILRYKNAPPELAIYFVLIGTDIKPGELEAISNSISDLKKYPNMQILSESSFLELITAFEPLSIPSDFLGLESIEY